MVETARSKAVETARSKGPKQVQNKARTIAVAKADAEYELERLLDPPDERPRRTDNDAVKPPRKPLSIE